MATSKGCGNSEDALPFPLKKGLCFILSKFWYLVLEEEFSSGFISWGFLNEVRGKFLTLAGSYDHSVKG